MILASTLILAVMPNDKRIDERPSVTVIGLGKMGAALAQAFLAAGHPTTVWNRSAAKADALTEAGATVAETAAEATAASPLVISCVLDSNALHDALDPAADALAGRALVNLTSGTPEQARATAKWATRHDLDYVDGKILAFPSTIATADAFLLYSGNKETYQAHERTLATLGSGSYLGADPGLASLYDLGLLGVMYGTMAGFLQSLAVLRAERVRPQDFLPYATELIGALPAYVSDIVDQVASGRFGGREANLHMQLAFLDHMVEVSGTRGVDSTLATHVKDLMQRAVDAGHGDDDVGRLLEEFSASPASASQI